MRYVRPGLGAPRPHRVRVVPRVLLHRRGDASIRIALAQNRVDGAAENLRVAGADVSLGVTVRLFRVVRDVEALRLQLLDRTRQLRDRRADVRQLDDIGLGRLRELAQLGQGVALPLLVAKALGKVREDSAGQRNVAGFDDDTGRLRECLHDRQQ